MGQEQYRYTSDALRMIARYYDRIYDGLPVNGLTLNPWSLAEFKADFDLALRRIGRGHWTGNDGCASCDFRYYRSYGRLQRAIIADILGVPWQEMLRLGFTRLAWMRSFGYGLMARHLNGEL